MLRQAENEAGTFERRGGPTELIGKSVPPSLRAPRALVGNSLTLRVLWQFPTRGFPVMVRGGLVAAVSGGMGSPMGATRLTRIPSSR